MKTTPCPFCSELIESDSHFCDQCGSELKSCPAGHGFKKGNACNECGALLKKHSTPASSKPAEPSFLFSNQLNATIKLIDGAIVGRRTGAYVDLFGSQPYVSGTHARFQRNETGQWEVVDLGSTNGTFLNRKRIESHQPVVLQVGDTLAFYDLSFVIE
jgi:hypothetical protein